MAQIRIGTRGSALALAQTELVIRELKRVCPEAQTQTVILQTRGDRILDRPLSRIGDKGLFVAELEEALLEGSIDLAVHSAKDLPLRLAEGLDILAVPQRGDPADVLVWRRDCPGAGKALGESVSPGFTVLPPEAVVGTGSLRRQLFVKRTLPQAECRLVRVNVPTRLAKLREGQYDALILARAGLDRLHIWEEAGDCLAFTPLTPEECLPAACQGIIAVEGRKDSPLGDMLRQISHRPSLYAFETEREVLRLLGADCSEPAAALSCLKGTGKEEKMELTVMYGGRMARGSAPCEERMELSARLCAQVRENTNS